MQSRRMITSVTLAAALVAGGAASAGAASSWGGRSFDPQLSGNAGEDPALTPESVKDLVVAAEIATEGTVNATPVVSEDGLLVIGDWKGWIYVADVTVDPPKVLIKHKTTSQGTSATRGKFCTDSSLKGLCAVIGEEGGALIDEETSIGHLGNELGTYNGVQSTAVLARVTTPGGEENRAYVPVITDNGLYCLNLDKIAADRGTLDAFDGRGEVDGQFVSYFCDEPTTEVDGLQVSVWPRTLIPPDSTQRVINGSPFFVADQSIQVTKPDGTTELAERDVIYTPTTGLDCANGHMWAIDAWDGSLYWSFDPVVNGNGTGGVIWTTPALSADAKTVFVTTGDCVTKPQVGEKAEALVALDAQTGEVKWWHQRRLIDTADLDIGVGPSVVDTDECNVVVSGDKDGCMYAYRQEADVPDVGDLGYDPLRPGQQRVLWRQCFVPGNLNGGFNASNGAVDGQTFVQQVSGYPAGLVGADDSYAFAVDACNGRLVWSSSSISGGRSDSAIASGMLFQLGITRKALGVTSAPYRFVQELQVVSMTPASRVPGVEVGRGVAPVLATVDLPYQPTLGGGGPAIVDGKVYVPTVKGVVVLGVDPGSQASPPRTQGLEIFAGPYPHPMAPGIGTVPPVNPEDPYPLMKSE